MRCRLLSRKDLDEFERFTAFLQRWYNDRIDTLSDPEMHTYLNITPEQAQIMITRIKESEAIHGPQKRPDQVHQAASPGPRTPNL